MRCEIESSTTRDDVPDAVDRVSLMVQPIVNSAVQTAAASNAAHGLARLYAPRVRLDRRAKATEDENTSSTEDRIALGVRVTLALSSAPVALGGPARPSNFGCD